MSVQCHPAVISFTDIAVVYADTSDSKGWYDEELVVSVTLASKVEGLL